MPHFDPAKLFSQTTAKINQDLSLLCERHHLGDLDLLRIPCYILLLHQLSDALSM
jgi:hypothetical protein